MYTAWCCHGRCADQMNAWLKLMIPLLLCPALSPPLPPLPRSVLCTESEGIRRKDFVFLYILIIALLLNFYFARYFI